MILVTGGTGLLGSHLLYKLVSAGEKPRAIKRQTSNLEEVKKVFSYYSDNYDELFSKIQWVDADILFPESLDSAFDGVEFVYHAAAYISFNPKDYKKLIRNNLEGTANIVDACIKFNVKKLLHVSSTAALGSAENGGEVTEDLIWSPDKVNTAYSVSKFKSEMEVWKGMEEGLNAVIVNPSIIFGPGFWGKGSSSMFTNIKKSLRYYTNGVTGYVGVNDVTEAMVKLMNCNISGERFIINSENMSYREVFTAISESLKVKPPTKEVTPFLSGLVWRLDAFRSLFGVKRIITRDALLAAKNVTRFSNEKIKQAIGIQFQPIKVVIQEIAPLVP